MNDQPTVQVVTDTGKVQMEIGPFGGSFGFVVVRPGGLYVVSPANPRTKKHRGRVCTYLGLSLGRCVCGAALPETDGWEFSVDCSRCGWENKTWNVQASVRYQDTGRRGVVDAGDLRDWKEDDNE